MRNKTIRIGGAAGYWGDSTEGAVQLVRLGQVDYLVFDYLAEVTMSILAGAHGKSADLGFATDFVTGILQPLIKEIAAKRIRVIANAGGVNLKACQRAIQKVIEESGETLKVAIVEGDNLLEREAEFRAADVRDMFSGAGFPPKTASINAYLGAFPIAAALAAGADIVVTGRVVDSAVTLGPLIHEFGWKADDFDRLAAGTLAGHLIECGCQVTGGNFTDWQLSCDGWDDMGYPIAECHADGTFVITKAEGTGGLVSPHTVGEQLLYEIGDPQAYIVPDVVCDFSQVTLHQEAANRVRVSGVRGYPPTSTYKVCVTYPDGYRATFTQTLTGFDAEAKARRMGEAIVSRCQRLIARKGWSDFRKTKVDLLGANTLWNSQQVKRQKPCNELVLRVSVYHDLFKAVDLFTREAMGSSLSMSTGRCAAGAPGRPKVSSVVRLYSFLLDKRKVPVSVEVDGGCHLQPLALTAGFDPAQKVVLTSVAPEAVLTAQEGRVETVPLLQLALARSGDKGNDANIGVIARKPEYLPYLRAVLTPQRVAQWFSHVLRGEVIRYDLPGIGALNFVLENSLGDGGVASLNADVQGKTYAQQLLAMPVMVPAAWAG
jgi:hypothetical protein